MNEDFYTIANKVHNDRILKEYNDSIKIDTIINKEYSMFCCWCYAFGKEENEKSFKEYLAKENKNLNFWIKKRIAELFFEYNFIYDDQGKKWKAYKNKKS